MQNESTVAVMLGLVHAATFFFYNSLYGRMRRGGKYREGKHVSFAQMPIERKLTKLAFATNAFLVLASFWMPEGALGFLTVPWLMRAGGLAVVIVATLFLRQCLITLGENYSPLFDSHRPFRIVREGPYRTIRHPIYLANMLIILGYVVAGASVWSLALGAWGWFYMALSIIREERFLSNAFPEYEEYKRGSRMIIPYVL
ncbi:MAG: isoprenylcysteine carboxylmethyltransferase family protein [Bdellovibrionota bacterium]